MGQLATKTSEGWTGSEVSVETGGAIGSSGKPEAAISPAVSAIGTSSSQLDWRLRLACRLDPRSSIRVLVSA